MNPRRYAEQRQAIRADRERADQTSPCPRCSVPGIKVFHAPDDGPCERA